MSEQHLCDHFPDMPPNRRCALCEIKHLRNVLRSRDKVLEDLDTEITRLRSELEAATLDIVTGADAQECERLRYALETIRSEDPGGYFAAIANKALGNAT